MKISTPLSIKKNKEEDKVIFMNFPFDKKKAKEKDLNKAKNIIALLMIIVTLVILLLGSTIMNQELLTTNARGNYSIVNKYDGNYAVIPNTDRVSLFKKVGFSVAKVETRNRLDKNYITTYAYYKYYSDITQADSITVYYNKNNEPDYINLNLVYKINDFNVSDVVLDCNNILKNFINIDIDKKAIKEVKSNGYYFEKVNDIDTAVTYSLQEVTESNRYYQFNIILER